ncbi:MAG: hypothetical protein AAF471_01790 [Myxococcota bacterium]
MTNPKFKQWAFELYWREKQHVALLAASTFRNSKIAQEALKEPTNKPPNTPTQKTTAKQSWELTDRNSLKDKNK